MIAVPGVPALANQVLPEREWETAGFDDNIEVTTDDGIIITAEPPEGWQVQDQGNAALLRNDSAPGAVVIIQAYDLDGRDAQAVAERLMRSTRVGGINTALDGGRIATADGSLTGDTCIALTDSNTGTCAYLTDGEVIVSVVSLGSPDSPAAAIADIVAPLTRARS